jgi:hypothetical protein
MSQKRLTISEKIYENFCLLTANDDFMREALEIRKKCETIFDTDGVDGDGEAIVVFYDQTPKFEVDRERIKKKFNLSDLYNIHLNFFLAHGIFVSKPLGSYREPKAQDFYTIENYEFLEDEGLLHDMKSVYELPIKKRIVIEIFPETTIKDIQNNWPKISEQKNKLYGTENKKFNQRKCLDRDLQINELKKQGKTGKEITKIINADERFKNEKISYQDVSKIIKRLKEKSKKVAPHKET